jgi:CxxC motif-containing protein (DUF1111 family)
VRVSLAEMSDALLHDLAPDTVAHTTVVNASRRRFRHDPYSGVGSYLL